MLVKDWMSTEVISIDHGASLHDAIKLLELNDIRMLPVLNGEELVGVITEMHLKSCSFFSKFVGQTGFPGSLILDRIKVEDVMSKSPVTVSEDFTVAETASVLLKNRLLGVVVTDAQSRIKGVITGTDINRLLVSVTGFQGGGIAFGFLQEDRPGSIKALTDIFRSYGGRLASILTSYEHAPKGYRKVHIRVRGLDRSKLGELQEALAQHATLLYRIDQRFNKRELFPKAMEHAETLAKKLR